MKHMLIPPRAILPVACLLATTAALPSCRRALWVETPDTASVVLLVDWSGAGKTPEGCKAIVYKDGVSVYSTVTQEVGRIPLELESGNYRVMVMSYSETEYSTIHFEDMNVLEQARAFCADATEFGMDPGSQMEPEWIAAAFTPSFTITSNESGTRYVRVKMPFSERTQDEEDFAGNDSEYRLQEKPLLSVVNTIVHLEEASRVRALVMHVKGLRIGWDFSSECPDEHTGTLDIQSWTRQKTKGDQGTLHSMASTFGLLADDPNPEVTLDFTLDDGEKYWSFSAPAQTKITREEAGGLYYRLEIEIEIATEQDPVLLPEKENEGGSGAGADAKVDGWDEQDTTIIDF